MVSEKQEIYVQGGNDVSSNLDASTDEVAKSSVNFGPIKRRGDRHRKIECNTCFKIFHNKSNLNWHMKRKTHIQCGLTATANRKISKKGRIEKICDMCKDDILMNAVDACIVLVRAQTNVDNTKKNITEICTTFEDAQDHLIDAERTFAVAQTNVISKRKNLTDIHVIFRDGQKILTDT